MHRRPGGGRNVRKATVDKNAVLIRAAAQENRGLFGDREDVSDGRGGRGRARL